MSLLILFNQPGGGATTLTAGGGSYALSGTDASLEVGREVLAEAGGYAITGGAASLEHGWEITADQSSYAITGTDANLEHGWEVLAGGGSYAVTGTDATLTLVSSKSLTADGGSYVVTGTDASLEHGWEVLAGSGSYTVAGTDATLRSYQWLKPDADISDGGWTTDTGGTDLWAAIDEYPVNDADFIRSVDNPAADTCEVGLSDPTGTVGEDVQVEYRYCKVGTARIDVVVRLKQGVTTIASWTHTDIGTTEVTAQQTLSAGQVSSITDYSALSLSIEATEV